MLQLEKDVQKLERSRNATMILINDVLNEMDFDKLELTYKIPFYDDDTPSTYKKKIINRILECEKKEVGI